MVEIRPFGFNPIREMRFKRLQKDYQSGKIDFTTYLKRLGTFTKKKGY